MSKTGTEKRYSAAGREENAAMPDPKISLRELFEAALTLPVSARAAYLSEYCGDATLRAMAEQLLAADAADHDEVPAHSYARLIEEIGDAEQADLAETAGSHVGPFTLLQKLGEGGSSVVFRAEREQAGVRQIVALKLLRSGLYSQEEQRNFRRERLALAQLRHPGIARLIEGDVTAAGVPYIALELVDGAPITEHAREQRLDLRHRLMLFVAVCRAVEAAHRALIVHRDLKPSNVLVTREGEVKLLDFGIAKLLGNDALADGTRTQRHAMTPAYAAPEQFTQGAITTATDVYSLGVLLGELVTGSRRERGDTRTPSSQVSVDAAPGVLPDLPAITRRKLRGDLDNIVLMATAAEPDRRYASAGAFADDIERYLTGQPVAAHPPSSWYRASKFVARHKGAVVATAAFLLILLAALGIALWQARVAWHQTRIAHEQAQRAEAVRQFMVGVFRQDDPDANKGNPITAQQLLDKGAQQVGANKLDPALQADAAALLASLSIQIGDFERAAILLKQALPIAGDPRAPRDIRARVLIGSAYVEAGSESRDVAISHARQGLSLLDNSMPGAAELQAQAHNVIAQGLIDNGDLNGAEAFLRDAMQQDATALGASNSPLLREWMDLARAFASEHKFGESKAAYEQGIAIATAIHGEKSNQVALALNQMSNVLSEAGDLGGAEQALRKALEIREQTAGANSRDTLAIEHNLLRAIELEGRVAEALPQRLQLIDDAANAHLLPTDMAFFYVDAGADLRDLGRLDESESMLQKALALFNSSSANPMAAGLATRDLGIALFGNLGATLGLQGRFADAEKALQSELTRLRSDSGANELKIAGLQIELGKLLRLEHRHADAMIELSRASAAFERADANDRDRPRAWAALSEAQLDAGDAQAAHASSQRSLSLARKILPAAHYSNGDSLFALARAELALGHAAAAEALLREALGVRSPPFPADDLRVLEVKVELAKTLDALGRNAEARELRASIEPTLRKSNSPYAADLLGRL